MNKKYILLLFATLIIVNLYAKPHKTVRVYTNKPVKVHHGKYYYVKVQPVRPNVIIIKPAFPGPKHIWIDGDWVWNPQLNQYVYVDGRWILPVQNAVWIPGRWKKSRFGWYWVNGRWR